VLVKVPINFNIGKVYPFLVLVVHACFSHRRSQGSAIGAPAPPGRRKI